MSEQNQLAISPVTAGLTGAAIGGVGNYFLGVGAKPQKGYGTTKELLTLEKDKFEALAKTVEEKGDDAAKAEFKKLADGRVTVSAAGDALVKEQKTAETELVKAIEDAKTAGTINVEAAAEKTELDNVTNAVKKTADDLKTARADVNSELAKATAEYRNKYQEAVKAITDNTDDGLGKELKALEDSKAGKTGDELAKIEENIKAKKAEIGRKALENDDVKTARTAMQEKKKAIFTADAESNAKAVKGKKEAYRNKLVENLEANDAYKNAEAKEGGTAIEKLKHSVNKWKETLAKKIDDVKASAADDLVGEKGALKDLDNSKFSKFLPKAKMWPAIIAAGVLGAAGVALAYIVGPKNPTPQDVA